MSRRELTLLIVLLAVVLDAALLYGARRSLKMRGFAGGKDARAVHILGRYFPLLTWLKYLLSTPLDILQYLNHALDPELPTRSARLSSGGISLPLSAWGNSYLRKSARSAHRWLRVLLPALIWTTLSIIIVYPVVAVVRDRWLGWPLEVPKVIGRFWELKVRSQGVALPDYFSMIVLCSILTLGFFRVYGRRLRFVESQSLPVLKSPAFAPSVRRHYMGNGLILLAFAGSLVALILEIKTSQLYGWMYLTAVISYCLGWLLREIPAGTVIHTAKVIWRPIALILILHGSLIAFLYCYHTGQGYLWMWVAVITVAFVFALRDFKRIPIVFWVISLALILYTVRINGWEFSVIGDEYSFFDYAQELATKHDGFSIVNKLFDGTAVFGSHPFFSSVIQMLFIKLFSGSTNFGWRIGSLYLSALSLGFFYLFFRQFVSFRISMLAVFFLLSSHYLMTFGKIGYNNLQALFVMSVVLACGAWAVRRKQYLPVAFFGLSMGLCFYVFPAALYILPVALLLMLFYDPPITGDALRRWGVLALSVLILFLPLVIQPDYWGKKVPGTFFFVPEVISSTSSIARHSITTLIYAFYSFLYSPSESHFVVASYIDPISGALTLLGLGYILVVGWRDRFFAFILASILLLLLLVGVTPGYRFPPTTRMFLLLPLWSLVAATGVEWLVVQVKLLRESKRVRERFLVLLLACVLALNLYQAYRLSPQRSTGYQTPAMLFVRLLEHIHQHGEVNGERVVFAFLTTPPWGIDGYYMMLKTYDVSPEQVQLEHIDIKNRAIPEDSLDLLISQNTLVIIYPVIDEKVQSALVGPVQALGKQPCQIKTVNGVTRFTLWYSPPMEWICEADRMVGS